MPESRDVRVVFSLHKPIWLHTLILTCCQFHPLLKAILPSSTASEGQPHRWMFAQISLFMLQFSKWIINIGKGDNHPARTEYQRLICRFSCVKSIRVFRQLDKHLAGPLISQPAQPERQSLNEQVNEPTHSVPASQPIDKTWAQCYKRLTWFAHAVHRKRVVRVCLEHAANSFNGSCTEQCSYYASLLVFSFR